MEETKNPVRKPVRLKEYGYGTGVYFVTIVAKDRQKIFSTITGSRQNVGGRIAGHPYGPSGPRTFKMN